MSKTAIAVKSDNPLSEVSKIEEIVNFKIGYAEKSFVSPFMQDERIKFELVSSSNYHETNFNKITKKTMLLSDYTIFCNKT